MDRKEGTRRRTFLGAAVGTSGLLAFGCGARREPPPAVAAAVPPPEPEPVVTAVEDLMREHGLLERILLVYGEAVRRIAREAPLDPTLVARAAELVRTFVEDYHERLEERFVFPELERSGRERPLVAVLVRQHERGRETTDLLRAACSVGDVARLGPLLSTFERMARPHVAREDTVLFPAFREIVSPTRYRELSERFEEEEHARFGPRGFEDALGQVAAIEAELGLYDLGGFTP